MKILNKIKKIFITMWIALIGFSTKVFCINPSTLQVLYGPPEMQAQAQESEQKLRIL